MQRAWKIAGGAFAVLCAFWAYESWQLSFHDDLGPGPGFFPFCLSLAGIALGIALVLRNPYDGGSPEGEETLVPTGDAMRKVVLVLVSLIAVTALLDVVGYRVAVAAFCVFLLWVLGARKWWVIVVFALAASVGVDALFSDFLKVPLPAGLFGS